MNELYKMVQDRQQAIARLMAEKEAEIESLQAESEKLDDFLNLGKELFEKGEAPRQVAQQVHVAQVPQPQQQAAPVQAQQPQTPKEVTAKPHSPEMPRVLPARQPREQAQSPKLA